jgi:antitoxin MazE
MTLQVIKKWGNSPALRIPNAVMQAVQLKLDQTVDMRVENGKIIIEPQPDNYRLEDLLAGITEENRHAEIDLGSAQGRENL